VSAASTDRPLLLQLQASRCVAANRRLGPGTEWPARSASWPFARELSGEFGKLGAADTENRTNMIKFPDMKPDWLAARNSIVSVRRNDAAGP
jgi:hypothetical protein